MSLTSLEGFTKLSGDLRMILSHWKFPRKLLRISFRLIFSVVSALVSRLLFSSDLVWRISSGSCFSEKGLLFYGGSEIIGGTDPRQP